MKEYKFSEEQERWLQALESGKYEQCKDELWDGDGYCCLGVACAIDGYKKDTRNPMLKGHFLNHNNHSIGGSLDNRLRDKLSLREGNGMLKKMHTDGGVRLKALASMNDSGWSFKQIAAYIRANPRNVFRDQQED